MRLTIKNPEKIVGHRLPNTKYTVDWVTASPESYGFECIDGDGHKIYLTLSRNPTWNKTYMWLDEKGRPIGYEVTAGWISVMDNALIIMGQQIGRF